MFENWNVYQSWKLKILGALLCFLLGEQSLSRAYQLSQDNKLFRQGSEIVDVRIVGNRINENKRDGSSTYSADLVFTTKKGETITVPKSYIHPDEVADLQKGENIQRKYAINNPQKIRLPNRSEVSPTMEFIFGGALVALGCYLVWRIYQALTKTNRRAR